MFLQILPYIVAILLAVHSVHFCKSKTNAGLHTMNSLLRPLGAYLFQALQRRAYWRKGTYKIGGLNKFFGNFQ